MSHEVHNELLSRFLRARRAALSPNDLGLPQNGRRRAPGLRREEVAALAGVSPSWYTWLEQGRDIRVSAQVLERLCDALRLNNGQREYLFALAHSRPAPLALADTVDGYQPSALLWRTLEALTVPALALTYRWDVVAWNPLILHFRDYSSLPPRSRNLLRLLVNDLAHRLDPEHYEEKVRLATSRLRADYSQVCDDPVLDDLIEELCAACPVFKRHWQESNQVGPAQAANTIRHPDFGDLAFEHSAFVPKGAPHVRVVIYVPADEECARRIKLLADGPDGEEEHA